MRLFLGAGVPAGPRVRTSGNSLGWSRPPLVVVGYVRLPESPRTSENYRPVRTRLREKTTAMQQPGSARAVGKRRPRANPNLICAPWQGGFQGSRCPVGPIRACRPRSGRPGGGTGAAAPIHLSARRSCGLHFGTVHHLGLPTSGTRAPFGLKKCSVYREGRRSVLEERGFLSTGGPNSP